MRPFPSKLLLAATAVLLAAPAPMPPMVQDTPAGLEDLFETGSVLQDRNGDGHVDFVAAHLVLGTPPSDEEVAAAANIAARLGFETSAMNLPITRDAEGMAIAVGPAGLGRLGASAAALGVDLEPGIGVETTLEMAFKIHRPRPATAEEDDTEVVSSGTNH